MKRWKKWLIYIGISILISLVITFILFCTLIANPFESEYENNLMHLIPKDSDALLYIPDLKQIWEKGKKLFPISVIQGTKGFDHFTRTQEYRRMQREWQNLLKEQQKIGIEFLKEEYLWEILKGEVAISLKMQEGKPKILLAVRISFLVRVAEGSGYYAVPADIATKYHLDLSQSIKKGSVEGKQFYWAFQNDLLILSNDENYILDSWRLLQGDNKSLWQSENILKNSIRSDRDILVFAKSDFWKTEISQNAQLVKQISPVIDLNSIADSIVSFSLSDKISMEATLFLHEEELPQYHQQIYRMSTSQFSGEILPTRTYAIGKFPIHISMLDEIYKTLPNNIKKEWDTRVYWLNKDYNTSDFFREKIFGYLDNEIHFACRRVDYVLQDIDIIDPYPAFAFFVKSKSPHEFYDSIKSILEKEVAKTKGKVKVEEKSYGNHKFLFLDVGGFDFTSGAIQPVFAVVKDYFLFTTHRVFFRSLVDVEDKIVQSWDSDELYYLWREYDTTPIELNISGSGILSFLDDFKDLWAESLAIQYVNRNPRGRNMEYHKQKLLREWQVFLDYGHSVDLNFLLHIQPAIDMIEIKTDILFKFNN